MPKTIRNPNPASATFRMRYIAQTDSAAEISSDDQYPLYYVYGGGKLLETVTDPAEAVLKADENVGTVLNQEWQ